MVNSSVKGDEGFEWGNEIADTDGYTMYKWYKYGGVTYSMYDSVFTFSRGAKNTDIGKITMIWETTNKEKKVKVLWYFRPADILNFLGDYKPNWNELFLASGSGKGLHTVVPLEAILGKCNVICTSKDRRNTPPSKSDYAEADYFFSHVFDVETRVLSSKLPDTIGPVKVERFLNEVRPKPKANVEGQRAVIRSPQTQDAEKSFTTDFGVKRETSFSIMFEQRPSEYQPQKRRKILENEIVGDEEADIGDGLSAMKLQKPAAEEKWLVKLTGEDEILAAYELRRLVTLINLDPSYTSSDVQEMILFAFKLKVDARIIPRRSSSSPLHGQALVIFNTMDEANFVVAELSRKCLIDDEGRPVVAFKTTLADPPKTKFPGHFELELHQMKKRTIRDKTMSTSHCAQPNTLESQMATQWISLHRRSERWYQAAHKMVMAVFAYIYHQSFVKTQSYFSVETILDQILMNLRFEEQLDLYQRLGEILQERHFALS